MTNYAPNPITVIQLPEDLIGLYHSDPTPVESPWNDENSRFTQYRYKFPIHILKLQDKDPKTNAYPIADQNTSQITFDFYDSITNCTNHTETLLPADLINALQCFIDDAISYDQSDFDLSNFLYELGYTDTPTATKQGIAAFKGCKEAYDQASSLFTTDLYDISNLINECENNNDYTSLIIETNQPITRN